jgi:hypothetical protein
VAHEWACNGIEAVASETQTIGDLLMLRLSSGSVMSRFGGYREGARGLLRRADSVLAKELKTVRASEIALSSFTFGKASSRRRAA